MQFSDDSVTYSPPSAKEVAGELGAAGLIVLAEDPPRARRDYALQRMNGTAVTGEVRYSREDDFELLESVRNWSTAKSLVSTYPDNRSRIDEHLMDFLANARHEENVAETFTSAEDSGQKVMVTVDGDAAEAELWVYGEERAIAFAVEPVMVTYVLPPGADTASFTVTAQ